MARRGPKRLPSKNEDEFEDELIDAAPVTPERDPTGLPKAHLAAAPDLLVRRDFRDR
jgi:hypothetical protein